eukprot:TRINITY_DN103885_c0_g1_i1.p1 TRINITY_DN103885_c0_g1~~TRINITY_DN103885_c0_g1_i1.p1  ORF type:complete len:481 (-),score=28.80 TRINITY_DN103885_c0_g1_i1:63-1505(-)
MQATAQDKLIANQRVDAACSGKYQFGSEDWQAPSHLLQGMNFPNRTSVKWEDSTGGMHTEYIKYWDRASIEQSFQLLAMMDPHALESEKFETFCLENHAFWCAVLHWNRLGSTGSKSVDNYLRANSIQFRAPVAPYTKQFPSCTTHNGKKKLPMTTGCENFWATAGDCKANGNEHFKKKDFVGAHKQYSLGLKALEKYEVNAFTAQPKTELQATLLCNRAACSLALHDSDAVVQDTTKCLELQNNNTKALYRRARAFADMRQWEKALEDLRTIEKLPHDGNQISTFIATVETELKRAKAPKCTTARPLMAGLSLPPTDMLTQIFPAPISPYAEQVVVALLKDGRKFIEVFHTNTLTEFVTSVSPNLPPRQIDEVCGVLHHMFVHFSRRTEFPLPEAVLRCMTDEPLVQWDHTTNAWKDISNDVAFGVFSWLSPSHQQEVNNRLAAARGEKQQPDPTNDDEQTVVEPAHVLFQLRMCLGLL